MSDGPVWAVITSFVPDEGLLAALTALEGQVAGAIVVDDGSGATASPVLDEASSRGATVLRLVDNSGIAAALNAGIVAAFAEGARSVVTLDQDSTVPPGFVAALAAEASRHPVERLGPVVPEFFAGVRQARPDGPDGSLVGVGVIQSGMLLDRAVVDAVGLMREDFFIDLVDTEYELRCLAANRAPIAVPGLRLPHRLGAQYRRRGPALPGIPRVMTLSTPFRYYYRTRNRVVLERLYGRVFPRRVVRDGIVERVYLAVVWALARPRRALWDVVRRGFRDGRRGTGGRAPADVLATAATIRWHADRQD